MGGGGGGGEEGEHELTFMAADERSSYDTPELRCSSCASLFMLAVLSAIRAISAR